ncbi:MAG: PAS domain-containing sensor histidine kinase [Planctomycetota bacterium]|nr:PAS domain-containing sensor histidine kinase [Planctomycetota bacterium]
MDSTRLEVLRNRCEGLRVRLARQAPSLPRTDVAVLEELESALRELEAPKLPNGCEDAHASLLDPAVATRHEPRASGQRLDDSERRWRALVAASQDALVTVDGSGTIVEFNTAAERLLRVARETALGSSLITLAVPERMRGSAAAALREFSTRPGREFAVERLVATALRSDGTELAVDITLVPHGNAPESRLSLCARLSEPETLVPADPTAYRARVRTLMAELLVAEERERQRLAEDLHDGLSQTLTLTQMKLATLRASGEPMTPESIEPIEELVRSADRAARAICFELSPPVLHHFGLSAALRWLAENVRERYDLEVELRDDNRSNTDGETCRVIVFRSIRELLVNAAKHSGVKHVLLDLRREGQRLVVTVEDHGIGMEQSGAETRGTGLLSMGERLAHVGGTLAIESKPGQGMRVRLTVPTGPRELHPVGQPS